MSVIAMKFATPEDKLRWGESLTPQEVEAVLEMRTDARIVQLENEYEDELDERFDEGRERGVDDVFERLNEKAELVEGRFGEQLRKWLDEKENEF